MYKVLLVDDERIILEGISAIVDWRSCGAELAGTARNGLEAKEAIERLRPDIVITDIKMPGMDGLQLIEQVHESDPDIAFIMLSGFSEFEYARTAMRYGVQHYLLKPCNEQTIMQALREVGAELDRRNSRDIFLETMETELKKVLPHAREQFLKELVTNKTYGSRDWNDFSRMFGIDLEGQRARILLLQAEGECEFEHLFALKNIAEELIGERLVLLSTTIGRHVLVLLKAEEGGGSGTGALLGRIDAVKRTFTGYYRLEATAALSEPDDITFARRMYREALECLAHRFYLGEGGLIMRKDIEATAEPAGEPFLYDEEKLCLLIKSGRWCDAEKELELFFEALFQLRLETAAVKSYLIPLYVAVVRQGEPARMNDRLQSMAQMEELDTLQALRDFVAETARSVCSANEELYKSKRSDIVAKVIECVEENLGNPKLSLHGVANDMLYMNSDYLGKLFKKETGEKFSNYVTRRRMERAVELIVQAEDVKVFELAEQLGFGDNPQYFSQVFKKHTGCSPSEFKRAER